MQKPLVDIVCCPVTRCPLRSAGVDELAAVNAAIAAGTLRDVAGRTIGERLASAWVTTDALRLYRLDDDIPVLLADEGVLTATIASFPKR